MHLACQLRRIRGDRTLRQLSAETGVNIAALSQIERGIMLARDEQLPALEQAYGQPVAAWYDPQTLLALQAGDEVCT